MSLFKTPRLYLASDHGGFALKEFLRERLIQHNFLIQDFGAAVHDPHDDYPVFAARVAEQLQHDPDARGILLCRSGEGMAIAANRFPWIRAAIAWNTRVARQARLDENTNVLCLPADYLGPAEAWRILLVWLETRYRSQVRFERRLDELQSLNQKEVSHAAHRSGHSHR